MDALDERNVFRKTISQINDVFGRKIGIEFEVVCWEDYVTPDTGIDAQDVVNQQVKMDYDIFVGIFKNRIGTATKRYPSGTIEEYERAKLLKSSKPDLKIMCYFLEDKTSDEILALKKKLRRDGTLFSEVDENGETTGVSNFEHGARNTEQYYSIDGRRLQGAPTSKGIYIVNGRKLIVK